MEASTVLRYSWYHFVELIRIDDTRTLAFYENECLKGNWSVRQLQRQIGSLLYDRTALSTDKRTLIDHASCNSRSARPFHPPRAAPTTVPRVSPAERAPRHSLRSPARAVGHLVPTPHPLLADRLLQRRGKDPLANLKDILTTSLPKRARLPRMTIQDGPRQLNQRLCRPSAS